MAARARGLHLLAAGAFRQLHGWRSALPPARAPAPPCRPAGACCPIVGDENAEARNATSARQKNARCLILPPDESGSHGSCGYYAGRALRQSRRGPVCRRTSGSEETPRFSAIRFHESSEVAVRMATIGGRETQSCSNLSFAAQLGGRQPLLTCARARHLLSPTSWQTKQVSVGPGRCLRRAERGKKILP